MERSLPKNYQTVYNVMCEAGHGQHLNAYDLFVRLRDRAANVSQTTVYRALERLVALHMIDEVTAPSAKHVAYELAAPSHGHFHCRICGVLRDVQIGIPESELSSHQDLQSVEIERTIMMFEGRCRRCV